jgi:hypothetical protein
MKYKEKSMQRDRHTNGPGAGQVESDPHGSSKVMVEKRLSITIDSTAHEDDSPGHCLP